MGLSKETIIRAPVPPEVKEAQADPRRAFGRFVIVSELGRGGMGIVYKAWDDSLGRLVALKLLHADADATAVERFHREALAVARVRHPSIVSVHDAGVIAGRPFLAMDFIDGAPLDKRIGTTPPLDLARRIEIVREVARAVQHAHEQGVIHRDLKPQNIMVDRGSHPYVMDFGLALVRGAQRGITRTNATLGTPSYMPPEQVEGGGEVDARSDVYALGATLYHVIAGRPPFVGPTDVSIITAVLTKDPLPLSNFNRRALGDLDTITARCLEKSPERRYTTASDVAEELERYLHGQPIVARPLGVLARTGRRLRRNVAASVAGAVAVLALVFGVAFPKLRADLDRRRHAATLERASAAARELAASLGAQARATLSESETRIAASRDGAELAAVASRSLAAVGPLADENVVREELRAKAASAASDAESSELDAAAEEALPTLGRPGLLAGASRLAARAYRKRAAASPPETARSLVAAATREGARAYRIDPAGIDGAGAFLEVAEGLLQKNDWRRALDIFATLSSRPLDEGLRARANLGAARALLAVGELSAARARLARARASGKLDPAAATVERWVSAVADRLAAPPAATGPGFGIFRRAAPGEGPPDRVLTIEDEELVVKSVDPGGHQSELARSRLQGKEHRSLVAFRGPEGELLATVACAPKVTLQFYRLTGDTDLQLVGAIDLGDAELASVAAAGDLDGDGRDELVLFIRARNAPFQRSYVCLIFDPLGRVRPVPLESVGVCDGYEVAFARLSGPASPASLIVNAAKWQGLRLHVFDAPGGSLVETFHRPLGDPKGLRVVREGDRDIALVGADREQISEAAPEIDASPDLGSDTPDAIWRLGRREGSGCELEPLLTRPFADRLTGSIQLLAVGVVPGYRKAFVAHQQGPELRGGPSDDQVVFVLPEADMPPVWAGLGPDGCYTSLGALPDLDGDGDPEIVLGTPGGLAVVPSSGRAPPPPKIDERPPAEASPLDVGLDLLACGEPGEARAQLEALIARPGTNASDRSRARLARARALSLLGDHEEARRGFLELAQAEPRWRKEALLLASTAAEEHGSFADAIADLDRLVASESLPPEDEVEVHRRKRRLGAFTSLTASIAIDRDSAETFPFELDQPLLVRRGEHGIRLWGANPKARLLHLPLSLAKSDAIRFRARFKLLLGYPVQLGGGIGAPGNGLGMNCDVHGGGNVSTWDRSINGQPFARFDPAEPVRLELTYVPSDGRIHSSIVHGDIDISHASDFDPIIAGPAELGFTFGWEDWAPDVAQVELEEVVLEFPPDAIKAEPTKELAKERAPEERELAAALRTFSLGDRGKSAPALVKIADGSPRPDLRKKAAPLAALALAEAGETEEAVGRVVRLLETQPGDLDLVFASVRALDVRSREALAQAYLRHFGGIAEVVARVPVLATQRKWGEAAIALHASGARERGDALNEATAWYRATDPETALAILDPLDAPEARLLAGHCAAALERLDVALEKWRGFKDEDLLRMDILDVSARRRAERLLAKAHAR
jgi:hypothetical protein